jgi:hypothetical protein
MLRRHHLSGLAAAIVTVGAISACGSSAPGASATGATGATNVTCTNYAIHASGKYRDEVSVRVNVANPTTKPAEYSIEVALTAPGSDPVAASATTVTIVGLVPAKTSAQLGRKVLTTAEVKSCRVVRLSRS